MTLKAATVCSSTLEVHWGNFFFFLTKKETIVVGFCKTLTMTKLLTGTKCVLPVNTTTASVRVS